MLRNSMLVSCSLVSALLLTACATPEATAPSSLADDLSGALEIVGQVVRSDDGASDVPVGGMSIYLFAPARSGDRGAQWVDYGALAGFHSYRGFWAVKVANARTAADGAFRFTGLRSGDYVLRVVPDVIKGCSTGAWMSLQLKSDIGALLVRAS